MKVNFVKRLSYNIRVGDKVEFKIGDMIHTDTIIYVMGHVIEGSKYDLTYVEIIKIN